MQIFIVTRYHEEAKEALDKFFSECMIKIEEPSKSMLRVEFLKVPYGVMTLNNKHWYEFLNHMVSEEIIDSFSDVYFTTFV